MPLPSVTSFSSRTASYTGRVDWPTPRFVPEGTGFNPYESLLSPSNVGDLQLAWSVATDGILNSTPIVVDGVAYVGGQFALSGGGEVYAYDAATGRLLWKTKGGGEPPSDLTVADGKAYVSFLFAHTMRVYDAATGDLLWSVHGPTTDPTVVNGVVYAADDLRSLWAIDAQTGLKLWVAHAPLGGYGFGLAVANGVVYVGGSGVGGAPSPVYAYDAATGSLLWRTRTGGQVDGTPAVANGMVYVGSGDHFFYALDVKTGLIRWRAATGSVISSSAAVANGAVYIGSGDDNVYAFNTKTGSQLWVTPTGGNITAAQAAVVANGVVYIGSGDGMEYAFDAVTGEQLWSHDVGGANSQSVIDGTLYVASFDANLYAFRLPAKSVLKGLFP